MLTTELFLFCLIGYGLNAVLFGYFLRIYTEERRANMKILDKIFTKKPTVLDEMTINEFAQIIAKREGKKQQVNIAQIMEIVKCINDELKGAGVDFYGLIKKHLKKGKKKG